MAIFSRTPSQMTGPQLAVRWGALTLAVGAASVLQSSFLTPLNLAYGPHLTLLTAICGAWIGGAWLGAWLGFLAGLLVA